MKVYKRLVDFEDAVVNNDGKYVIYGLPDEVKKGSIINCDMCSFKDAHTYIKGIVVKRTKHTCIVEKWWMKMERTIDEIYDIINEKYESAFKEFKETYDKMQKTPALRDDFYTLNGELEAYTDVIRLIQSSGVLKK